jgi:hypothetical protein
VEGVGIGLGSSSIGALSRDALAPAEFRDAVFSTQAIQHNADFLLGRILFAGRSADVLHDPLGGHFGGSGFLANLHSSMVR